MVRRFVLSSRHSSSSNVVLAGQFCISCFTPCWGFCPKSRSSTWSGCHSTDPDVRQVWMSKCEFHAGTEHRSEPIDTYLCRISPASSHHSITESTIHPHASSILQPQSSPCFPEEEKNLYFTVSQSIIQVITWMGTTHNQSSSLTIL